LKVPSAPVVYPELAPGYKHVMLQAIFIPIEILSNVVDG
jgi:hypothetical protein